MFTRALESVKTGTLIGSFCPKYKKYDFKFINDLCVMAMKIDTKIEEDLTCRFKTDMRNFANFDWSAQKS